MNVRLAAGITIAALAVTSFIAVALLLFDASAFPVLLVALIVGFVLAVVFPLLVDFILHLRRHHPRFTAICLVIVVIALTAFAYSRAFHSEVPVPPASSVGAIGPGDGIVTTYHALVTPEQPSSNSFTIEEDAAVGAEAQTGQVFTAHYHAAQVVTSSQVGFALRRVTFTPFHLATSGLLRFRVRLPHTRVRSTITVQRFCDPSCPDSIVQLDLSSDAFYRAARTRAQPSQQPISWTAEQPDEGITFYYLPAGYRAFRPLLEKFIGVTSVQQGVLIALGIFLAFLISFGSALWLGLKATAIAFAQGHITGMLGHVAHHGPQYTGPATPDAPAAEAEQRSASTPASSAGGTQSPAPRVPAVIEVSAVFAWPIAAVVMALVLRSGLISAVREARRERPESVRRRSH